ncbi:PQQ-binding-like beta-propeller repeat protein [Ahrensia marina]|uniref:outer membrane protein assembly factor BamB family protein n=1 Tax=Ahrensia marina TaxID=1514904 RepID=UPI0035D088E7
MRSLLKPLTLALCVGPLLAGCAGGIGETFDGLNPFNREDPPIPGERRAVGSAADPVLAVTNTTVSIPGASGAIDWPQPGGNAANNPGHVSLSGAQTWSAQAGIVSGRRQVRMAALPVVAGGRAYVYDPNGNVTAVAISGGGQSWRRNLRPEGEDGQVGAGGVALGGGRVFAATGFGQLFALDANSGQTAWAIDLDTPALSAPTFAGEQVYVITQSNTVLALSAADGTERWRFRGVPATAGLLGSGTPAVSGNTVIVPYSSGEIVALNATDGEPRWADAVVTGARYQALSGLRDLVASPVIASGSVIATGVGGRTISVGLDSGNRQWETNVGSVHTPIVAGDVIFLVDLEGRLMALSRSTGDIQWATRLPGGTGEGQEKWAGPALADNVLFLASSDGNVLRVNPANGEVLGTTSVNEDIFLRPIAAGGRLLALAADGTLLALN